VPRIVDHEQRRARFAEAAAEVIATSGVEGLTMRDVARRAGSSTGMLTHYFADRDELLLATFLHAAAAAGHRIERSLQRGLDPLDALVEGALPLDAQRRRAWQVWLAFWGSSIGRSDLAAEQRRIQRAFHRRVQAAVEAARTSGRFHPDTDVEATTAAITSLIDGLALQVTFDPRAWPAARQRGVLNAALAALGGGGRRVD
jgi:AcrR family transcriptional regulator